MMKRIFLFTVLLVFVVTGIAGAWTQFNDGSVRNIDYRIDDDVWVDFGLPGMGTTVNFLNGGGVFDFTLQGHEDSIINIVGGQMSTRFHLHDRSQGSIISGSINKLEIYDNSQMKISGGDIGNIDNSSNSQMTISGGNIADMDNSSGQISMSGGYIYSLTNSGNSQMTVSGGSIEHLNGYGNSQLNMSGGIIDEKIMLQYSSILKVFGLNFFIDGTPIGYGEIESVLGEGTADEPFRILSGTLASGEAINNIFLLGNSAKIILAPVPVPSTLFLLGFGLLGLAGVSRKKK